MKSDINAQAYVEELRRTLPYVPPIPVQQIKALHGKGDLAGVVKLIRSTMNVNVRLTLHWTDQLRDNTPARIELPSPMPYYGTPEFAKAEAHLFIRKSFAKAERYNKFAMAIAHEFSHVVLESTHHRLKDDEKAVDLTAMILGFSYLYRRNAHVVERTGLNTFQRRKLGYLSERELDDACRALLPAGLRARHQWLSLLEASAGFIVFCAILGAICFSFWITHPGTHK